MKLYRVPEPQPCDIENCPNTNAVLVVRTSKGVDHAICPTCVRAMRQMSVNKMWQGVPCFQTWGGIATNIHRKITCNFL